MRKLIRAQLGRAKRFTGEHFFKTMIFLAIPVILQSVLSSSLYFIDSIMVGSLGDDTIAGVGLANQVFFLVFLFMLGVSGGASMFISQFWGKKDIRNIHRTQGLSLLLGCAVLIPVVVVSVVFPHWIMSLMIPKKEVIEVGSTFLRISSPSYILYSVSLVYAMSLRNTGHPRIPLIANGSAVVINTALNYLLIFGHFGFPKMGAAGAATATCIARTVEISIILGTVYSHKWPSAAKLRQMFDIRMSLVKKFFSQSGIIIAKDLIWAVGIVFYNRTYSQIGAPASSAVSAAVQIIGPVSSMAVVLFTGVATASQIMVGNQLGVDNMKTAYLYATRFMKIAVLGGLIIGCALYMLRDIILLPYDISPDAKHAASNLITVFALYMPLSMFSMVSVVGVLRSGGDTITCLIMDTIAVYLIGMPLILLGVYVWHFPVGVIYAMVMTQEFFKVTLLSTRILSKRWMNNLTHGIV
jgi:putative MATE family efflux protein